MGTGKQSNVPQTFLTLISLPPKMELKCEKGHSNLHIAILLNLNEETYEEEDIPDDTEKMTNSAKAHFSQPNIHGK